MWWNPAAGMSPAEREWLEEKYPGWNDSFGKYWDVITDNLRAGQPELTLPETLPDGLQHVPDPGRVAVRATRPAS